MKDNVILPKAETDKEYEYMARVRTLSGAGKKVFIQTFGCQQNEADSERLLGMAEEMGYIEVSAPEEADLIIVNTCAVREHAELKALSITGGYKHCKEKNPGLIIGICGCMVSQEHRLSDIKNRYPYIDFLLGTTLMHRFPEILYKTISEKKREFWIDNDVSVIEEGLPVKRSGASSEAMVSVMYGCNNFCTYCIVPYVRGRERSREPEAVIEEVRSLISSGIKEITLLGQNVNSYRPKGREGYGFADLLEDICSIEGEAVIHFMTSHPKDATHRLIDVMAANPPAAGKVGISRRFHLPLQSGSDRVLKSMNRRYTSEHYLSLVRYMREKIPGIAVTTDIIVGFPGETEEDFSDTLKMLEKVRYDNIYSFIYSKRKGTPASEMSGQIPDDVKSERFARLIELQTRISKDKNLDYVGKRVRALVEGRSKTDKDKFTARTETNRLVHFYGNDTLTGRYVTLQIESAEAHSLYGRLSED